MNNEYLQGCIDQAMRIWTDRGAESAMVFLHGATSKPGKLTPEDIRMATADLDGPQVLNERRGT